MQLPYSEELNIEYLGRLFDNTSECYKFFWFDALITKVIDGKNEIDYEEMVDEMIAEAYDECSPQTSAVRKQINKSTVKAFILHLTSSSSIPIVFQSKNS